MLKTKSCGLLRVDLPADAKLDVDDVLIARQHQALLGGLGPRLRPFSAPGSRLAAIADFGDLLIRDRRLDHRPDRPRPIVIEAGVGLAGVAPNTRLMAISLGWTV